MVKVGVRAVPLAFCGVAVAFMGARAASASPTLPIPERAAVSFTTSNPGYQAGVPGAESSTATGSFTAPRLRCTPRGLQELVPSVLVSGFKTDSIVYAGAELVLRCQNGTPSYSPFFITPGASPAAAPVTVRSGDTLNIQIADSRTGSFTVTVHDGDQMASLSGFGFPVQQILALAPLMCGPAACPPYPRYPQFGEISYSGVAVNGMTLRQLGATGQDGHNGGTGFIKTTALNSTGAGFKLVWKHS